MPSPPDVAVYIGRFQPFHAGHLSLLKQALALAPRCIVVLGSSFQARTPKNPWSWQERAEMIRVAVPEEQRERLGFLPLRDYYDEARWIAAVQRGVEALMRESLGDRPADVALLGHFKDATSNYLRGFAGWRMVPMERAGLVDAVHLRDALFAAEPGSLDATLAALVDQAPRSTLAFLRAWSALPYLAGLAEEWRALKRYHAEWAHTPYPPVFVTVDAVLRCAGRVLLIRRGQSPGKGLLAVPGGFIDLRETAYQSAVRELREETGLGLLDITLRDCLRAVAVFDHPERSQRGRTITHAHCFELSSPDLPEIHAADDAQAADWVPIERIASMEDQFHDDHFHILDHFFGITADAASTVVP